MPVNESFSILASGTKHSSQSCVRSGTFKFNLLDGSLSSMGSPLICTCWPVFCWILTESPLRIFPPWFFLPPFPFQGSILQTTGTLWDANRWPFSAWCLLSEFYNGFCMTIDLILKPCSMFPHTPHPSPSSALLSECFPKQRPMAQLGLGWTSSPCPILHL